MLQVETEVLGEGLFHVTLGSPPRPSDFFLGIEAHSLGLWTSKNRKQLLREPNGSTRRPVVAQPVDRALDRSVWVLITGQVIPHGSIPFITDRPKMDIRKSCRWEL